MAWRHQISVTEDGVGTSDRHSRMSLCCRFSEFMMNNPGAFGTAIRFARASGTGFLMVESNELR